MLEDVRPCHSHSWCQIPEVNTVFWVLHGKRTRLTEAKEQVSAESCFDELQQPHRLPCCWPTAIQSGKSIWADIENHRWEHVEPPHECRRSKTIYPSICHKCERVYDSHIHLRTNKIRVETSYPQPSDGALEEESSQTAVSVTLALWDLSFCHFCCII